MVELEDDVSKIEMVSTIENKEENIESVKETEETLLEDLRLKNLKKKINAESWTSDIEDLIKSWGEKAALNRDLHTSSAEMWKNVSDRLTMPTIILTTISSVSAFGSMNVSDIMYSMYAVGTINLVAAFLTSLGKYYRPDEKVEQHTVAAKAFGKYYRNIVLELSLSREDRQPADVLSKWARTELDKLINESPVNKKKIIENFKKNNKCENIAELIDNNHTINIYGRS